MSKILILNLPGLVLKSGSRWYNTTKKGGASLRYYPYPWFMGYTTSLLKKNGFDVVFKDAVAMEWTPEETLDYVNKLAPEFVICEPTWVSVNNDLKLLNSFKSEIVKIVVGNYATNFPFECLKKLNLNYVVVGEYEFSLLEFFKNSGRTLPKNFIGKEKESFEMPDLVDLDLFPWPERNDTPWEYYNEPSCFGKNIVMVSSRGCRLKCDFCNVECIYGRHAYRIRSAKNVVDEMEYLKNTYKFDEIYFDDDNMVASKSHVDEVCREIIKRGLKIKYLCMGDGLVDDETLKLLAKSGCTTYKYGLEHLDEEVLKAIPKPLKKERLLAIIKKCRELGMRSYTNLIVGLPKSTRKKDLKMLTEVIKAKPDLIQIAIATPYPGTTFYRKAKENGWLVSEDPGYFDATGKSAISYPDYSAEEIQETFKVGWQMWYRYVVLKKPKTLWFFVSSEVRRNGLLKTAEKVISYLVKMLKSDRTK
jgi:anaerobic magnesium-protoporphyrin IX monomethyl ester cyclase